jgi:hypothetical protein
MIDKRKLENRLFFTALAIMIIGLIGLLLALIHGTNTEIGKSNFRLPLSAPSGIVVDQFGKVYCGIEFYSRVQVYGPNGRFIMGLTVPSHGGDLKLKLIDNNLAVIAREHQVYKFDLNGKFAGKDNNVLSYPPTENEDQFSDGNGSLYKITNPYIFPQIIKNSPGGNRKTIVSTTILEWFFMCPIPALIFSFAGFVTVFIMLGAPALLVKVRKYRKKHKGPIIKV